MPPKEIKYLIDLDLGILHSSSALSILVCTPLVGTLLRLQFYHSLNWWR